MKNFLKMIEVAKTQGMFTMRSKTDRFETNELYPLEDFDIENFTACQPIVFMPKNLEPVELEYLRDESDRLSEKAGLCSADLDAPFKVFSIEMADGPITSPRPTDEVPLYMNCIMAVEVEPKKFGFYILMERPVGSFLNPRTQYYVVKTNSHYGIVKAFLDRLNTERVGVESTRTVVKIGSGKSKRQHRIRRVVHVASKSYAKKYEASGENKIDFSHRFFVRGHWVSLRGRIGKDREGNYCVNDWTWRSEYIKGPENAPLITKTRIVD